MAVGRKKTIECEMDDDYNNIHSMLWPSGHIQNLLNATWSSVFNFLFIFNEILYNTIRFQFQNAIRTQKALLHMHTNTANSHKRTHTCSFAHNDYGVGVIFYLLADNLKYVNVHLDSIHRIIINDGWLWEFLRGRAHKVASSSVRLFFFLIICWCCCCLVGA